MKIIPSLILIVLCAAFFLQANAQTYEPTILILSPSGTKATKALKKEIAQFNDNLQKNQKQKEEELQDEFKEIENESQNIKIMGQKQIEFSKEMDFYSVIPSVAEGYLQYRFAERFENLLIYATTEKSSEKINQMATIADKHNMQYVVNFPEVKFFIAENNKISNIRVQLYDNHLKKIMLDKVFVGDDRNPGFEFSCSDSSLTCTINNALSQALGEIITIVATHNPTIIRGRELARERVDVLFSTYYPQEPVKDIPGIIENNDTSISVAGFYHGFMNEDKTKFIGFFALNSKAKNFQELRDQKDQSVQILTDDIYDLENVPRIYANVVVGINYKSKWYLKKSKVTYFNADNFETGKKEFFNNLQKWNFFKEDASEYNPDFWESNFFKKVKDVTQEPDYEKYYESIYKSRERKNKGYVGMYEIVADKLRKEQRALLNQFKVTTGEEFFRPFLEQQKTAKPDEFADYSLMYKKFTLIFPKDKSILLNPVLITDSQDRKRIRYFVLLPNTQKLYEWTYFKPVWLEGKMVHYGNKIFKQLSTVTAWNFGFDTLDDQIFWSNYVLLKEGEEYKYLKEIE